jgi:hypothetical protein
MFPLGIFPLPGELVPLHIFEPRYRQLLQDAESRDFSFGIYFNHTSNTRKLGSLVKLESVIKRCPSGESDIIVKCVDLFEMITLFRTFKDKMYPGGEVSFWNVDLTEPVSKKLQQEYIQYLHFMNISNPVEPSSSFHIANELNLDIDDRLKFVQYNPEKRESFLNSRLSFQKHLLLEAEKLKDSYHLN